MKNTGFNYEYDSHQFGNDSLKRNEGGYNHMELRRYKRAYNDSDNGIVQGQPAKPMDEAMDWLFNEIFN